MKDIVNPSLFHISSRERGVPGAGSWSGSFADCLGDITALSRDVMLAAAKRAKQAAPLQSIAPIPYQPVRLRRHRTS
jgi:hypothetical protein